MAICFQVAICIHGHNGLLCLACRVLFPSLTLYLPLEESIVCSCVTKGILSVSQSVDRVH